jgi:putative MATE family efflux protein
MHEQPDSMRVTYIQMRFARDALMYEYLPTLSRLRKVSLPVVYENLFTLLVGWSDSALAGRIFQENRYLASVTVGSQLFLLITAVAGLISVGAGGMTSRRYGAGQLGRAGDVLSQALLLSLMFGCVLSALVVFGADSLVRLIRLSDEARPLAAEYTRIVSLSIPMILVQHACCACLRSCGQTWAAFRISLTAYLVTIGVSWGLALSLKPFLAPEQLWLCIPIGTAVGYTAAAGLALVWVVRGVGDLQVPLRLPVPDSRRFRQILSAGVPGGSIWVIINFGALWHLSIVAGLGDASVAAHGVILRLEMLCWVVARALSAAAASLGGQALGADRPDLATGYGWLAAKVGMALMSVLGVFLWLASGWLVGFFIPDVHSEAYRLAMEMMPLIAIEQPALALTLILTTAMVNGASDTAWPLGYTAIGALVIRVSLAYLLTSQWVGLSLLGAWLAIVADYYFRGIVATLRFAYGNWQASRF